MGGRPEVVGRQYSTRKEDFIGVPDPERRYTGSKGGGITQSQGWHRRSEMVIPHGDNPSNKPVVNKLLKSENIIPDKNGEGSGAYEKKEGRGKKKRVSSQRSLSMAKG